MAFAAGGIDPNPNIINQREAMKIPDREGFEHSMGEEVYNLTRNVIYDVVLKSDVPSAYNILRVVWNHRRKISPGGLINRHRSRIFVDGSQQQEGIDYFETYSSVVMWPTLRLLFILGIMKGWKSRKFDYVQGFPQT